MGEERKFNPLPDEVIELVRRVADDAVMRAEVPHPCTVRCFRVGAPSDLYEDGKCMECGWDGRSRKRPSVLPFEDAVSPLLVGRICDDWLSMREALRRPEVLSVLPLFPREDVVPSLEEEVRLALEEDGLMPPSLGEILKRHLEKLKEGK